MTPEHGAFSEAARYYVAGRPPYSRALLPALQRELALDGHGRLLDAVHRLLEPGGAVALIGHRAEGRPDIVRDIDSVVAGYYSTSSAAPRRFGHSREAFETALRELLRQRSPQGLFWDWPGDTEIVLATK